MSVRKVKRLYFLTFRKVKQSSRIMCPICSFFTSRNKPRNSFIAAQQGATRFALIEVFELAHVDLQVEHEVLPHYLPERLVLQ